AGPAGRKLGHVIHETGVDVEVADRPSEHARLDALRLHRGNRLADAVEHAEWSQAATLPLIVLYVGVETGDFVAELAGENRAFDAEFVRCRDFCANDCRR